MSQARRGGTEKKLRVVTNILLGTGVAVLTWGILDPVQVEAVDLSNDLRPATAPMLMTLFIGFLTTALLYWSGASLFAASFVLIVGIVVGGRPPPFLDPELGLILLRGTGNPGLYALVGSWLALAALKTAQRLRQER